jgi:thiol-disulfide isomerase/thioredoxin
MILIALLVLGLVGAGALLLLRNGNSGKQTAEGLKHVPSFSLPRSNGEKLDLEDWKDHVVVVHFWATWCPPCIPELPEILGAAKKMPKDQSGRAIYWLLISQDESWEKAHAILKEETLPENVFSVLDPEAKVSDGFGSYQFPETYLISRQGGIAAKWIGAQEWSGLWGDQALAGIEQLSRTGRVPSAANP